MSKMPWFRAYTEMIDDDKLRLLAFEDRWHFIGILCLKGQGIIGSDDPLLMRKAAVKMGLDLRTLEEVVRRLAEVGLIDKSTLEPLAWDARQMKSDSSAERVKAYRERKKKAENPGAYLPDMPGMYCNGNGNDPCNASRNVTVTAQDTDTDTEEEKEGSEKLNVAVDVDVVGAAPSALPAKKTKPARIDPTGTRLPADWQLPKRWGEWALLDRPDMTADAVRREAECFADHWHSKPGKDGRKSDWEATWRNWIRRANGPVNRAVGKHLPGVFTSRQEQIEEHNRAVAARVIAQMQEGQEA